MCELNSQISPIYHVTTRALHLKSCERLALLSTFLSLGLERGQCLFLRRTIAGGAEEQGFLGALKLPLQKICGDEARV